MSARELVHLAQSVVHGERRRSPPASLVVAASSASSCCRSLQPSCGSRASGTRSAAPPGVAAATLERRRRSSRTSSVSDVVMTSDMLRAADAGVDRPRRHARAAMRDLPRRRPASAAPIRPTSPASTPASIYKQLKDFKTGARVNAVMTPFAVNLSDQDMRRPRGLLRLSAAPAGLSSGAAAAGAAHRRSTARRCATSRLAAPATASSTTRPAAPGSRASRRSISRRSSRPSRPAQRRNDISEQMRNTSPASGS